ncbi:MAG: nitronate monooxygenase family protein [Thermodesulfobacteriota bacterium]|nr:nitronate monooxygenase family protein [Thermodesulfobacteriota bacterium]
MAKKVLRTEVCDMLGIEYPIFLAGMGALPGMPRTGKYYTGTSIELVAAVSNAGGFGVLGAAGLTPEQIPEAVSEIRALTPKPFGIDFLMPAVIDQSTQDFIDKTKEELPAKNKEHYIWLEEIKQKYGLSKAEVPDYIKDAMGPEYVRRQFDAALSSGEIAAVCSGVGTSKWAVDKIHEAGKLSVSLVGNVRQAKKVAALGADIIVAQGTDAGGHTGTVGTLALIPQVVDAVAPIPVLGAGGIGDGRGVAAAFSLGAKGVWVGTAFLASQETSITDSCRQRIIDSTESGTFITKMFTGKTVRCVKNPIAQEWNDKGLETLGMPFQVFFITELCQAMEQSGNAELFFLPTGQVAGMIDKVRPAKEIFDEMLSGSVKILKGGDLDGVTVKE